MAAGRLSDAELAAMLQSEEYAAAEGSGGDGGRHADEDDDGVYVLDDGDAGGGSSWVSKPSAGVPLVATAVGGGGGGGRKPAAAGASLNLAAPEAELLDPHPDIRALFAQYDAMFFGGRLGGVEVRWSPRMTLCAGLCVYQSGGYCSVRLSEPLLKLRPRSDTVNTLLHEMIHAYLFVTRNNKDRSGHGPEFLTHAERINRAAKTAITVYHSFHDEVVRTYACGRQCGRGGAEGYCGRPSTAPFRQASPHSTSPSLVDHLSPSFIQAEYQKHVWRCNGPCADKPPRHGFLRRAMNRPPGPTDWWCVQRGGGAAPR